MSEAEHEIAVEYLHQLKDISKELLENIEKLEEQVHIFQ